MELLIVQQPYLKFFKFPFSDLGKLVVIIPFVQERQVYITWPV